MSDSDQVIEPRFIQQLPVDKHGRRIPWFVPTAQDGHRDFRLSSIDHANYAVAKNLCWICGHFRGHGGTFNVGPLSVINRISSEPPSHRPCATYAVQQCPFLVHPGFRRRERGMPEDRLDPGEGLAHNAGVHCVWSTTHWKQMWARGQAPVLFDIGAPARQAWYTHGRLATRDEVVAALNVAFDIAMPIAYEEGADSAARLQAAHLRAVLMLDHAVLKQ